MERIISSDTMKTLMGEDFDNFVDFIFTPGNEKFKWKFEQTRSYDLELDIVKQPVIDLTLAGIFSEATRDRILNYQLSATQPSVTKLKVYSLPAPDGVTDREGYGEFISPYCQLAENSIGLFVLEIGIIQIDGVCTHPDAREV